MDAGTFHCPIIWKEEGEDKLKFLEKSTPISIN